MRASDWKYYAKPLAAAFPDFELMTKGLVKRHPWVAECLLAESTDSRKVFYLEAFALPLFVPTDCLYFSYGFRIGQRWDAEITSASELVGAVEAEMPRLHALATTEGLTEMTSRWREDPYQAEVRLCLSLLADDQTEMGTVARALRAWHSTIDWEEEIVRRCLDLIDVVTKHGMPAGLAVLEQRRSHLDLLLR